MPQIQVNEIDQSVVTRVVKDDRVHILVPVISSFGPSYDGDGKSVTANTFTDVTAFDRVYGYTPAQFNPIQDDQSRTYARELIKKGAAVTAVRVNGGAIAEFDLGGTPAQRETPSYSTVTMAVKRSDLFAADCHEVGTTAGQTFTPGASVTFTLADGTATSAAVNDLKYMLPGSFRVTGTVGDKSIELIDTGKLDADGKAILVSKNEDDLSGTVDYSTSVITITGLATTNVTSATAYAYVANTDIDYSRHTFAPQIDWIKAKYSGSFGNDIMMCITPVNTSRLAESFQYANISVYYVERNVVYDDDNNLDWSRTFVKNTTLLETKMVTTNPSDPRYFEDVEFDFIKIHAIPEAREQLSLVWSNINAHPESTSTYPGFPSIQFKVAIGGSEYAYTYNFDAFATKTFGTDFNFSTDVLSKLKQGFKGYIMGTKWTQTDVNNYIEDVYGTTAGTGNPRIFQTMMTNIASLYQNFTDPYIYDFDFITSGGFVYEEYEVTTADDVKSYHRTVPVGSVNGAEGTVVYTGVTPIHEAMKLLVTSRKDCIALIDVPKEYDPMKIIEYSRLINTSYATMHFPWCKVASPYIAGMLIEMAPSYIFMYTYLQNLENNADAQKWFPPAGVTRATARVVKKPDFEIGSVILDDWQNNNTSRVNPIMKLKQYGYVVYGQYTCLEAIDMFTHSALESLNVRLVANAVKKKIFDTCLNLAFDPNTEKLWLKFFAQMDEYLRFMKYNEGVYDYKIIMDESTVTTDDINHLRCPGKVYIAPTRTAEFFDIDFIITDAGAVFTD